MNYLEMFKANKLGINCQTSRDVLSLLSYFRKNKYTWKNGSELVNTAEIPYWDVFKENTCFINGILMVDKLGLDIKVITYKTFKKYLQ